MWMLSNILIASGLAVAVWLAGNVPLLRRRPGVMHWLWLIVLAKFITPAFIAVPLLPARDGVTVQANALPRALPVNLENAGIMPPSAEVTSTRPAAADFPWRAMLLGVWFCGSAVILGHAAVRCVGLRRLLRHATEDERLSRRLKDCGQRMALRRVPKGLVIGARCSPFLLGISGRARVYVPAAMLERLSENELEAVLCHELAHHLRRDVLANVFAFFVLAAVWWNPLVWLARHELRCAQELCCDAMVISRQGISRRHYAEMLLATLDQISGACCPPAILAAGWGDVSSLKGRFRMIGDSRVFPEISRKWQALAMLLAVGLVCIPGRAQSKPGAQSNVKDGEKSHVWEVQLIDGETGKPLMGIRVDANGAVYTTDDSGIADVSVPEVHGAMVSADDKGWWTGNMNLLGNGFLRGEEGKGKVRDPNRPVQIKAWRGTMVRAGWFRPRENPWQRLG